MAYGIIQRRTRTNELLPSVPCRWPPLLWKTRSWLKKSDEIEVKLRVLSLFWVGSWELQLYAELPRSDSRKSVSLLITEDYHDANMQIAILFGETPIFETVVRARIAKLRNAHASEVFNTLLFNGNTESVARRFGELATKFSGELLHIFNTPF